MRKRASAAVSSGRSGALQSSHGSDSTFALQSFRGHYNQLAVGPQRKSGNISVPLVGQSLSRPYGWCYKFRIPILRGTRRRTMAERRNALTTRDGSGSANATVVALPRSAEKVDRELVEHAVSHIRDELAKTVTRGMDEVGRYLLKMFYDDDPELY